MQPKRILIIDDEAPVREVMQSYLKAHGFSAFGAGTAFEGLELARKELPHLVILDVLLPDLDGFELLSILKKNRPQMPVVVITGCSFDAEVQEKARLKGAAECMNKTTPLDQLVGRVEVLLSQKPGAQSSHLQDPLTVEEIAAYSKRMVPFDGAGFLFEPNNFDLAVKIVCRVLSAFHPNLGTNALRAVALCRAVGHVLKMPESQSQTLLWAAALHDIALLSLNHELVRKWLTSPGKCSAEELQLLHEHPRQAEGLLDCFPKLKRVGEVIRAHHEHWDGSGFPDRLTGEAIPWLSRLLGAALYYCNRQWANPQAIAEMRAATEKRFDPRAIEATAAAAAVAKLPPGEREVLLAELSPGMVLASDIRNRADVLILGKGRELTTAWINKISNINAVTPLDAYVRVYC